MNREPRAATLTKAIDVLMVLLAGPQPLATISRQTTLPKGTVHRLLEGLAYEDLVIQVDQSGTYALGPGCLRLAEAATKDGGGLARVAMPVLERIWAETDETVAVHVRVGYQRVCVTEVISAGPLRYVSGVGSSAPLHVGSAGKVLLAFLRPQERKEVLDWLRADAKGFAPKVDSQELAAELAKIRRQGWATSFGERVPGAGAVTAPLFAGEERLLGALSLLGPADHFGPDRMTYLRKVCVAAAAEISELMSATVSAS